MTSYLITGGAGFIGSHLADRLIANGHAVVALDDLSTGRHVNVAALADEPRFKLVVGSATNAALIDPLVHSCDVVVHLAGALGAALVRERPLHCALTNVTGTSTVLAAAGRHKRPVLIASSSDVYGYDPPVPVAEDAVRVSGAPADMRAAYAAAKALEESLALAWTHEHGLPVTVARLFSTAGPRQRPEHGMVVPRLVQQALSGRQLRVFGDGRQTRCFAHVLDVVEALDALAGCRAAAGEVFNVGSQEEVSILELAERVMYTVGINRPVDVVALPAGVREPRRIVPDIAKIASVVGWRPTRGLEAIVRDVVAERGTVPQAFVAR
jgi:UDP-glucose 4-epimerase